MSLLTKYNQQILAPPIFGLPRGERFGAPPLAVPNTLPVWWFDSSNGGSLDTTAGATNTQRDISGAGQHATAAGTNRPTSATRTQNGLNVLDYDGVDDRMTFPASSSIITTTTLMVFMVDNLTAAHTMVGGAGGTGGLGIRVNQTTGAIEVAKEGVAAIANTIGSVTASTPFIVAVRTTATTCVMYVNRRSQSTTHAQTLTGGRTCKLGDDQGNGAHMDGWLAEMYRYHVDIGDAQTLRQIDYLNGKWRIY